MNTNMKKLGIIFLIIFLISTCLYLTALVYSNRGIIIISLGLIALLVIGILPALFIHNWQTNKSASSSSYDEEEIKEALEKRLKNSLKEDTEAQDILHLTLINTKQLRCFYSESRQQAKKSFFLAVTMCIIGGLLLCLSITAIIFFDINTITLTIGAIGGSIVEFIAGTSFYVYRKSLRQYNHYYRSLHENERLLLILHLASKLTNDISQRQADMYSEIIRSQLEYINKEFWQDAEKISD